LKRAHLSMYAVSPICPARCLKSGHALGSATTFIYKRLSPINTM
jgi:hypothetical protein